MAKGEAYKQLGEYLKRRNKERIILTFEQIEGIIGRILPQSAYKHPEPWWSNNYEHSQAIAWMDAGYETDFVTDTYALHKIIFCKITI
ncbi:hypothetical protein NCCP2222_25220 [Sporosarcina sp. NCCP-2222]|uniref:DUF7662 domain-containing protein n=1 Tax=Sporosarcina sp. NCCP-2222 TaxID=2935073 RepID=UPI00208C5B75|nr:hypothetical protein [Sporosarcina sp. NCCP-2222]GKV56575.1 hypothetical protein NCCP2222_25220 [Sporosarcina sp. NCCP-2222]